MSRRFAIDCRSQALPSAKCNLQVWNFGIFRPFFRLQRYPQGWVTGIMAALPSRHSDARLAIGGSDWASARYSRFSRNIVRLLSRLAIGIHKTAISKAPARSDQEVDLRNQDSCIDFPFTRSIRNIQNPRTCGKIFPMPDKLRIKFWSPSNPPKSQASAVAGMGLWNKSVPPNELESSKLFSSMTETMDRIPGTTM